MFYALFVCGHYFVPYGFMQVCVFYRFFSEIIFGLSALCRIEFNVAFINFITFALYVLVSGTLLFILSYFLKELRNDNRKLFLCPPKK